MSIQIQVIFYSMVGRVYRMAEAVAEGAKQALGAEVSPLLGARTHSGRCARKTRCQGR